METRDVIITACKSVVAICLILFAAWLVLLWLCLYPFRLALIRSGRQRAGTVSRTELESLLAVGMAGVALLRSGRAPMTMREWKRARRRLYNQRPDDTIPF